MKALLDQAAKDSGRSQSQEAEYRIELSFRDEDFVLDALAFIWGTELAALLLVLAEAMELAQREVIFSWASESRWKDANQSWWRNAYVFSVAAAAAKRVLDRAAPRGEATPLERSVDGRKIADRVIAATLARRGTTPTTTPADPTLDWTRRHLGSFWDHLAASLDSQERDET